VEPSGYRQRRAAVSRALVSQIKVATLELGSYRDFLRGPQPSNPEERSAWKWGRIAMTCWVVVMISLAILGLGLKTFFR
jgi:hypothetical protein